MEAGFNSKTSSDISQSTICDQISPAHPSRSRCFSPAPISGFLQRFSNAEIVWWTIAPMPVQLARQPIIVCPAIFASERRGGYRVDTPAYSSSSLYPSLCSQLYSYLSYNFILFCVFLEQSHVAVYCFARHLFMIA